MTEVALDEPPPCAGGLASAGPRPLSKAELRAAKPDRATFAALVRRPVTLVLDNCTGAHNVGTILRLADALLIERVWLCGPKTPTPPSHKIKRSSRGAERWAPWQAAPSALPVLAELKDAGQFIVAAELAPGSVLYDEAAYRFPLALVLGGETSGVSPEALALADLTVHLPIYGMANSISVAAAAAVMLYALDRRLPAPLMTA